MGTDKAEDIHASYLHWMEEASAYRLAELADCGAPDSNDSPGAEILEEVRDAVIQVWRAGRFDYDTERFDHDLAMECAEEGIIPAMDYEIVALFADLAAWTEHSEFTEKGKWEGYFIDLFKGAISQITERAAIAFVAEVRSDFDQHFQCPECGDTGTPHVCYPGDCRGSDEEKATHAASLFAPAEAILTGPIDLPAVKDPILDLISERERADATPVDPLRFGVPGDETSRFMASMAQVNAVEFAQERRRRWVRWVVCGLALAGLAIAYVVI